MSGYMDIKIGAFDYKLKEVKEVLMINHVECSGIIDYEQLTINIKEDMNEQRKKQTILHEVLHGIIREYDIEIGNVEEEYLVDILGTAMLQIIKDNKDLIDYIQKYVIETRKD